MKPKLISSQKIWDAEPHCAMTDLIHFQENWFCAFRESDRHVHGRDGLIRIIQSTDGIDWTNAMSFGEPGADFRDPKFSLTPDGRLMLLFGVTYYENKKYVYRQPRVSFSADGIEWTKPKPILTPHEWLWRVTWHDGIAYGASYSLSNIENMRDEWHIKLFKSSDGIAYDLITQWDIPGYPSEATLQFLKDGTMIALVRREKRNDNNAWIGSSVFPYKSWQWNDAKNHLGGPNFVILPHGNMWAAGRIVEPTPYGVFEKTALAKMTMHKLSPELYLPSGGEDTSYPGLVYDDGVLWMSYYSSHEGTTAIYLARIQFNHI